MAVAKQHLLSAAKRAISAAVRHPPKGRNGVADNGSVPLPETVLPQTPFGFPLLRPTR